MDADSPRCTAATIEVTVSSMARRPASKSLPITEIDILWVTAGLGCDGDTISATAATQPSLEDIVLGELPVDSQGAFPQSLSGFGGW